MSLECSSQVKNDFNQCEYFLMCFLGMVIVCNLNSFILQFQNGMHIPFRIGAEQQLQPLSWLPNNDSRQIMFPEDPNLLPHR